MSTKTDSKHRYDWIGSIPFLSMHLGVIAVFFVPFSWQMVLLCMVLYWVRMFGITAGYHRYFAHKTYKMNRFNQFLMAVLGTTALQKGVLYWSANHRLHHRHSDKPADIHSPIQHGFWWSHIMWIMNTRNLKTEWKYIQDFAKYPELRWLNTHYLVPAVILAVVLFVVGGWAAFVWGFVVSTVLLWHGTFCINSLTHLWGSRRYATTDGSRNSLILALVTFGEGWHNNHHCYQNSTKMGFFWWEIDISYYALKVLSWVRVVKDMRMPPLKMLDSKRIKMGAEDMLPELIASVKIRRAPHRIKA